MARIELSLSGSQVERFLRKKGIEAETDRLGRYPLGVFSEDTSHRDTLLGEMKVSLGWVEQSNNREVVIGSAALRRRGTRVERRISVDNDRGEGVQEITTNVVLLVRTNAHHATFAKNPR